MKKKSTGNVISNSFNSAVEAVSDKANEVMAAVKKQTAPARKKAEAAVKDAIKSAEKSKAGKAVNLQLPPQAKKWILPKNRRPTHTTKLKLP